MSNSDNFLLVRSGTVMHFSFVTPVTQEYSGYKEDVAIQGLSQDGWEKSHHAVLRVGGFQYKMIYMRPVQNHGDQVSRPWKPRTTKSQTY